MENSASVMSPDAATFDESKVVWDNPALVMSPDAATFDASKLVPDDSAPTLDMRPDVRGRLAMAAAAGDPLMIFGDRNTPLYRDLYAQTARLENPDAERRKMALAAYFAGRRGEDIGAIYRNIDEFCRQYNGNNPASVESTWNDLAGFFRPAEVNSAKELTKGMWARSAGTVTSLLIRGMGAMGKGQLLEADMSGVGRSGADLGRRMENMDQATEELEGMVSGYYRDIDREAVAKLNIPSDWMTNSRSASDWTRNAFYSVLMEAPNMAIQAGLTAVNPGLTIGYMGVSSGNDKYTQLLAENPEMGDEMKLANVVATGFINGALEKVTVGILKGRGLKLDPETLKAGFKEGAKYYAKSYAKEAGEEFTEQLAENLTDIYTGARGSREELLLDPARFYRELLAGTAEAGFIGGVYGVPFAAAGHGSLRNLEKRRIGSRSELEAHKTQLLGKPELDSSDHADLNMIDKALDADDVGQLTQVLDILGAREASRRALAAENPPDLGYEVAEGTDGETILAAKMAADRQALSNVLRHDPEDTGRKVAELAYHFPAFRVYAVETVAELPAEGQRSLLADGIDPFAIRAYTDKNNAVWVVTHNTRPSEVSKVVGHEIIGHHGLRAVFQVGFDSFLDGVYRDHAAEILNLAPRYNVNPDDDASNIGGATAEEKTRYLAEEYLADLADAEVKPSWYKGLLSAVRTMLRRVPGFRNLRFTDKEIESALVRSARVSRKKHFPEMEARGKNGKFALRDFPDEVRSQEEAKLAGFKANYDNALERYAADELRGDEQFDLGDTPDALTMLGVPQVPVRISAAVFEKAHRAKHDISIEGLRQIPHAFYNPVMIFRSSDRSTNPDGMVVLTQIKDVNMKPVTIAVNVGKSIRHGLRINDIATITERNIGQILGWINDGFLLYSHKKRALAFGRFHRLQLPKTATQNEHTDIIIDDSADVKPGNEKNGRFSVAPPVDTPEFKRWFGDSKVVDENGKPLVVYHGTNAEDEFYEFSEHRTARGYYFSRKKDTAESYASLDAYKNKDGKIWDWAEGRKSRIIDAYLNIRNPEVFDMRNKPKNQTVVDAIEEVEDRAVDNGRDGIIVYNAVDPKLNSHKVTPTTIYAVFSPDQIKSATDNTGAFDPENPDIRFSLRGMDEDEKERALAVLRPFVGSYLTKDDAALGEFMRQQGFRGFTAGEIHALAVEAARSNEKAARARADKKRDDWLYENNLIWQFLVDQTGTKDFKVKPSARYDGAELSGTFFDRGKKKSGHASDALAREYVRKFGGDELDAEERIVEFLTDLTKPTLWRQYYDFRANSAMQDQELDRKLAEELQAYYQDHPEEAPETAEPGADGKPGPEAWKVAYDRFRERLAVLREQLAADKADAVKLQREALSFAEKELPKEARAEFVRRIVGLSELSNTPTKANPEGRRMAEFRQIMDDLLKRGNDARKVAALAEIQEMLDAHKMKRNYRGVPVSVIPEMQGKVDRIRQVVGFDMFATANAVEANNDAMAAMEEDSAGFDALREDNLLLELFGNLKHRDAKAAATARDLLARIIKGGRETLRAQLAERRAKLEEMRLRAIADATGGRMETDDYTDAKHVSVYGVGNRTLATLLRHVAGGSDAEFDSTVAGELWKGIEDASWNELTEMNRMQGDYDGALREVFGIDGMVAKGRLLKKIGEKVEKTGVFVTRYSRTGETGVTEIGRSSSLKHVIPIEDSVSADGTTRRAGARSLLDAVDNGRKPLAWDGIALDDVAIEFLRQQVADHDAGVKRVRDVFGDASDDAAMNKMIEENERDGKAVIFVRNPADEAARVELALSPGAALQLYLTWEQPHYRSAMQWNGWTEESIAQLKTFLGPEMLEFGRWMRAAIAENRARLDRAVFDRFGAHLPEIENYFPVSFKGLLKRSPKAESALGRGAGSMSMTPGFLIARKFHLLPPDYESDAFSNFLNNQLEQAHFLAWSDILRDLKGVFGDRRVQNAIKNHHGDIIRVQIIDRINTLSAGGGAVDGGLIARFLGRLFRYWMPGKIALNISSAAKQIAGVNAYANVMPLGEFYKNLALANFANPEFREFVRFAKNDPYLANRLSGGLDKDLIYMLNHTRDSKDYSPWADAVSHAGTWLTRRADAWSALHGGFAVYRHARMKALASGMDAKAAHDQAARAWKRATDETQQSGYLKDLNEFQANQGMTRYFTMFLSNPIQVMNLELQTLYDLRHGQNKGAAARKLARQIMVNHVILPALMTGISQLLANGLNPEEWEWEDLIPAMLLGQFEGMWLVGKLLSTAGNTALDLMTDRPIIPGGATFSAVPLADDAVNAIQVFSKLFDDNPVTDKEAVNAFKSVGDVAMILGAGHPAVAAAGMAVSSIGSQARRFLRLFGEK